MAAEVESARIEDASGPPVISHEEASDCDRHEWGEVPPQAVHAQPGHPSAMAAVLTASVQRGLVPPQNLPA